MQIRGKEKKKDREWLDAEDERHSGGLEQISVGGSSYLESGVVVLG